MGVSRTNRARPALRGCQIARNSVFVALILTLITQSACAVANPSVEQTHTPNATTCQTTASHADSAPTSVPTPAVSSKAPLVYGTNFALYDSSDQAINEPAVQELLQIYRVPIIRMPFRPTLSDAFEVRAMRAIRSIGALPLIIVHGPTEANALADDTHIISLAKKVFGDSVVYVEFGNEPELAGISAQAYARSWNTVVSCLKSLAPHYKFIGPANSFFNPEYIATFDRLANPRPDFNSWHEYACGPQDSNEVCMFHVRAWTTHFTDMNKAVRAAIGVTIPFMITEWNLDDRPDSRYKNSAFIQAWTTTALHILAANQANGLYAAMQYCVANNPYLSLVGFSGLFTPAGQAFFQALYQARAQQP